MEHWDILLRFFKKTTQPKLVDASTTRKSTQHNKVHAYFRNQKTPPPRSAVVLIQYETKKKKVMSRRNSYRQSRNKVLLLSSQHLHSTTVVQSSIAHVEKTRPGHRSSLRVDTMPISSSAR
ncbi:hypothetical protein ACN47E_007169 [Coniothyrium glycines]